MIEHTQQKNIKEEKRKRSPEKVLGLTAVTICLFTYIFELYSYTDPKFSKYSPPLISNSC